MQKRTLKVALLAALAAIMVLGVFGGVALADQTWKDLPDTVTAKYGIADNQISAISEGFPNGLWKPYQPVTRAQFTKMAVAAFKVDLATPATASFTDVPSTSMYYKYVEGAKAAGMINGVTDTQFKPGNNITREQAIAIVSRYIAKAAGYNLATMYTEAEMTALLNHFGDAASISSALKAEVAFAFDFGITEGNAFGNLAPAANLTRIQAAAFLIRAEAKVPPTTYVPAKIELVTADKSENLIGVPKAVTFKVSDATGHPASGVLVDFDVITSNVLYVGNVEPEAAVTDNFGEVTINLISTEPGTERVSATVAGVAAIYTTAYWLALDEVYITDLTREAENNVGEAHNWTARVVVFGPGPRSTSTQDWYNAIDTTGFDPADVDVEDGVDVGDSGYWDERYLNGAQGISLDYYGYAWDFAFEKHLAAYYDLAPRTLAGIDVNWAITDYVSVDTSDIDNDLSTDVYPNYGALAGGNIVEIYTGTAFENPTSVKFGNLSAPFEWDGYYIYARVPKVTLAKVVDVVVVDDNGTQNLGSYQYLNTVTMVPSVGNITAVDGAAITPAKTAVGKTDAAGASTIKIESTVTGGTYVTAVADYAGNPYPKQLFNHSSFYSGYWHDIDWDDQPADFASAMKTWIPHVIGENDAPIVAASLVDNTGEVEKFTLTLKDTFGNVIPGYTVQWWIQGAGEFKNDGSTWSGVGEQNKDVDTSDALGQSVVYVTSDEAGQTILHCKVMDKYGLPYHEWNVVKQWYSIDDVSFLPTTDADGLVIPAVNLVNTPHTFTAAVTGMKKVFTIYDVNQNGLSDDQVLIGDRADLKAASGDVLDFEGEVDFVKDPGVDLAVGRVLVVNGVAYTRFADITLGTGEYWAPGGSYLDNNEEDVFIDVVWRGLPGKNVWFFNNIGETDSADADYEGDYPLADDPYDTVLDGYPMFVGSITAPTTQPVVTDAAGHATVTVNSTEKGNEWVWAVADYDDNQQDGDPTTPTDWAELQYGVTQKTWVVSGATQEVVYAAGQSDADLVEGTRWVNPVDIDWTGYGLADDEQALDDADDLNPNYDILVVAVFDEFGNALPGYKVTFELLDLGGDDTSGSIDTYYPYAHFATEGILTDMDADFGHTTDEVLDEGLEDDDFDANKEGIFDRNRNVDANPLWDNTPAEADEDFGRYDDDKAVGYTLDGEIDGVVTITSAAYATLVLDETYDDLDTSDYDHFTSRVNIQVWAPNGTLVSEKVVTKEWSLEEPELDNLVLLMSEEDDYSDLVANLTTDVDPVYIQVNAVDQFGNLFDGALDGDIVVKVTMGSSYTAYVTLTDIGGGIWQGEFSPENGTGAYKLTPFTDTNADGNLDSGEFKGSTRTLTWED